jgi:hypothetical protein
VEWEHELVARSGLDRGVRFLDKQGSLSFSVPSAGCSRLKMSGSAVRRTPKFSRRAAPSDLNAWKTRHGGPVSCNGWILIMASSHRAYLK